MDNNNPFAAMTQQDQGSASQINPFASMIEGSQEQGSPGSSGGTNPPQQQGTFWDNIDIINRNFANVANGGLQAGASALSQLGIDTSGFQQNLANQQAMHQKDYTEAMKNSPISGTITDIGSKIGAAVATPGTQPFFAAQGVNIAGRMGLTAAGSAIVGGSEYVDPGESRVDNAISSGLTGGVGQLAGEAAGAGYKAAFDDVVKPVVNKVASKLFTTPVQEAAASADKGLLTTMGSATGNKALQGAEDVLGRIPIAGAKRGINKQVNALKQETQGVLDDIGVSGQSGVELGEQFGKNIVISDKIATAKANQAYTKALTTGAEEGKRVPLPTAIDKAKEGLEAAKGLTDELPSTDISGSPVGRLLNDIANLKQGSISPTAFETLRKRLKATEKFLKQGDTEGLYSVVNGVRKSLDDDLDTLAATTGGKFGVELKEARKVYATEKAPFKNLPVLEKSLSGKIDTDQLLNQIVQGERPQLTKKLMGVFTPEAKQDFTKAIIHKALNAADDKVAGLDLGKFSTQIHKLGETITALPKMERDKILGLQRLLTRADNMISTAKAKTNNLPTWLAGIGGAITYGTGGLGTVVPAAVLTKGISAVLTSPRMTKQLIKLAGGKLAQTAQDGIIKSALKTMLRVGSIPAASAAIGVNRNDK